MRRVSIGCLLRTLSVGLALGLAGFTSERAGAQETVDIPLQLFQVPTGESGSNLSYKLGILVGLGGGAPQMYEFDTGGKGFWASYANPVDGGVNQWWGTITGTQGTITNTYSSGNTYDANVVQTSVQLYTSTSGPAAISVNNMQVAQITQGATKTETPEQWNALTASGSAPLYGTFFGDFGASLATKTGTETSIWSVLPQLGGSLGKGFVVSMGGNPYSGPSPNPVLTVGITDAMRAEYPIVLSMSGSNTVISGSDTWTAYGADLLTGTMTLSGSGQTSYVVSTTFVTDTGAPSTSIHNSLPINVPNEFIDDLTGELNAGTEFIMNVSGTNGGDPLAMDFFSGTDQPSYTTVQLDDSGSGSGYVNTGLNLFFRYNVMYDLENGVVRLQPIAVPEPGVWWLVAGGLGAGLWRRRRAARG